MEFQKEFTTSCGHWLCKLANLCQNFGGLSLWIKWLIFVSPKTRPFSGDFLIKEFKGIRIFNPTIFTQMRKAHLTTIDFYRSRHGFCVKIKTLANDITFVNLNSCLEFKDYVNKLFIFLTKEKDITLDSHRFKLSFNDQEQLNEFFELGYKGELFFSINDLDADYTINHFHHVFDLLEERCRYPEFFNLDGIAA